MNAQQRLIESSSRDPDSSIDHSVTSYGRVTERAGVVQFGVQYGWLIVLLALLLVALLSSTHSARALFSFGKADEALASVIHFRGGDPEGEDENAQTAQLLMAARNLDPNPAKGGGDIVVVGDALQPESGPAGSKADLADRKPNPDEISLYIVREGDSLSQIAEMFGVTSNTIRWANDLGVNGTIRPGQTLVILPVTGVRHTVEKGDTLRTIAKEYDGNLEEIMQFNGLEADAPLAVGDVVTIPGGEAHVEVKKSSGTAVAKAPTKGTSGPAISGYYTHPVPGSQKTQGIHGYNGVDLGAPTGTPILASANGSVIVSRASGWNGGYGNYIVIDHPNGTQTLYSHLSENIVSQGAQVVQGQVIGYVGATGRATGPHLHFEIRGAKNPF